MDKATSDEVGQAESSSQSLKRLTTVCQNWRSFTSFQHVAAALQVMDIHSQQEMWPGQDDSKVTIQHSIDDPSALQLCMDREVIKQQSSILNGAPCCAQRESSAADLEFEKRPGCNQHKRDTADDPVSCCITASGDQCLAETADARQDQSNLNGCQQHWHTDAEALTCGSRCRALPSGKVMVSPQIQRRGRARLEGYDVERSNQENSSGNILSNKGKGRPGRVSCRGKTQDGRDFGTSLAGWA